MASFRKYLSLHEVWWAKELCHVANIMAPETLKLLSDDAIDDLHSVSMRVHNMLTAEYRKRMGVVTDEVP